MKMHPFQPKHLVATLAALMILPAAALAQDAGAPSSTTPPAELEQGTGGSGQEQQPAPQQEQQPAPQQQQPAGTGGSGQATRAPTQRAPASMLDVEELNDDITSRTNKKVTVAGEISEFLDARSFVLESGGIFDDEITVVLPKDLKGLQPQNLREEADVVVTGTVRELPVVEARRELGWDLDPQLELELEGVRHFLVAERITRQRN